MWVDSFQTLPSYLINQQKKKNLNMLHKRHNRTQTVAAPPVASGLPAARTVEAYVLHHIIYVIQSKLNFKF